MKRSEVNDILLWAADLMDQYNFKLPPFARWTPKDWAHKGHECDEIRNNMLGWDITDFGRGDFNRYGLVLFTLRNGNINDPDDPKPYAEKIMVARAEQICPLHFHWEKIEDIINRGGGNLVIELFNSHPDESLDDGSEVNVKCDGVRRTVQPGEPLTLRPGESITLTQGLYHRFYGEPGAGPVLIGEVSAVNDDTQDNRFAEDKGRFPDFEPDEPPLYYLCNEYPAAQ